MAKRAVCISCFDFYEDRVELVMEHLRSRGYECTYITGDYSHFTREKYTIDIPGGEQVPTLPYRKNMSVARLLSHRLFAFHAFRRAAGGQGQGKRDALIHAAAHLIGAAGQDAPPLR